MRLDVCLSGPAPWGFRLVGGKDFKEPLTVSRITPGSKAEQAQLTRGDIILMINGMSVENLSHLDAQNKIKSCNDITLTIDRPENKLWSPNIMDEQSRPQPFKMNLEGSPQDTQEVGSSHNRRGQPFVAATDQDAAQQIVNAQYNTPISLYSSPNIDDVIQGQHGSPNSEKNVHISPSVSPNLLKPEGLKPGSRRSGEVDTGSAVYKMLQEPQEVESQPKQSSSFRFLQDMLDAESNGLKAERPISARSVKAPASKQSALAPASTQKLNVCERCNNGIVGMMVKVRDQYRHPECFVCTDCGSSLKQKGYIFVEGHLYCEQHAKARVQAPEGYEVVAVYPNN
uniref:PDZ and LIM domain protein 1 n=1 Tax=Myxine glutinosa TaxID=7769 RepID=UPI00358FC0EF